MNSFIFGRYIRRDSLIHALDARIKFIIFIMFLVCFFIKKSFVIYFGLFGILILLILIAKLPKNIFLFILKIFLIMFLFLLVFNIISVLIKLPKEKFIAGTQIKDPFFSGEKLKWFRQTVLINAFYFALRVSMVIMLTIILITTTRTIDLTNALTWLLKPLEIVRFPIHIFTMIITLSLRLVTTLIEEANSIMDAQASRGLDFYNGNLKVKIKSLISLLIPLFISIFKRADEMALALESRGYDPYAKRSQYHQTMFKMSDWIKFSIFLLFFGIVMVYLNSSSAIKAVGDVFVLEQIIQLK